MFLNLKNYYPCELGRIIKTSQKGKLNLEKNEQIKKTILNIEFMYNELKNNF